VTEAPTPAEDDPRFAAALELWLESQDVERVRSTYPEVAEAVLELAGIRGRLDRLLTAAEPPSPASLRIPGYEVERLLGKGGQGAVFVGRQIAVGRRVAIKILWREGGVDPAARARFSREARAAGALRHPATVAIYDAGETDGMPWIVMEYVAGGTLAAAFAARREGTPTDLLPAGAAARAAALAPVFAAVADGLAAAHAAGVVHRDVKPSNLLVAPDGALKIADFGLATTSAGPGGVTLTGRPLGTLGYMAPEQARGDKAAVGPAADVYGLGVVLFEAAVLRPAFSGDSDVELLARIVGGSMNEARPSDGALPGPFLAILRRATETDPRLRYPTAAEFAADLRAFAAGLPVAAERARPGLRAWAQIRRRPGATAAAVFAAAAAIVFGVVEHDRREQATRLRETAATARGLERDRLWDSLRAGFLASLRAAPGARADLSALQRTAARIAAEFPGDRLLVARAAAMLSLAGDADGASRTFDVNESAPKTADALLVIATTIQTPERVATFVAAAEREGPFDAFQNFLAGRALAFAEPARAEAYLRAARTAPGGDPVYVVEIGRIMADLCFRRGDAAEADEWLTAAYRESRSPSLLAARLPLLAHLGRTEDVRRVYERLAAELPKVEDSDEWGRAVRAVVEFGDFQTAFALTGAEPRRADPVLWADLRLRTAGGALAAAPLVEEISRVLDAIPPDVRVLRVGMAMLTDLERMDLAERRFAQIVKLDPDSADTALDAAMWAALRGDEQTAWARLADMEKREPDAAERDVSRARVLTTLGDAIVRQDAARAARLFAEAATLLRTRLPKAPPKTNWGETLLSIEAIRLRDGAAAAVTAAAMMRTLASADGDVERILRTAAQSGAHEVALEAAVGALAVQPTSEPLLELRVRLLAELKRDDEAVAAAEEYRRLHPRSFAAGAVRAQVIYRTDDDPAAALAAYRELFAAPPPAAKFDHFARSLDDFLRLAEPRDAELLRARLVDFRAQFPTAAPNLVAAINARLAALAPGRDS
jgi:tRNA A-37 threonylcarbamoyl transferase component Bud32